MADDWIMRVVIENVPMWPDDKAKIKLRAILLKDHTGRIGVGDYDWVRRHGRQMNEYEIKTFFPGYCNATTARDGA